jgi:hypothetical protein
MMGTSDRCMYKSRNKVGVGEYDLGVEKNGGISFGKERRFGKDWGRRSPGFYHIHSTLANYNLYRKKNI